MPAGAAAEVEAPNKPPPAAGAADAAAPPNKPPPAAGAAAPVEGVNFVS